MLRLRWTWQTTQGQLQVLAMSEIASYIEFKFRLDDATAALRKLEQENPEEIRLNGLRRQLEALDEWTKDGKPPTLEEKGQLNFGLLASYYLAPMDPDLTNELYALNYFILYWKE